MRQRKGRGFAGMDEALETPYYEYIGCDSVTVMFSHYFDDSSRVETDRGELSIMVDGPPWELIETYNEKGFFEEEVDLSEHLTGGEAFRLQFAFRDDGNGNYGWSIDDVEVVVE